MRRWRYTVAVGALSVVALAACDSGGSKDVSVPGGTASVSDNGDQTTVKDGSGQASFGGKGLPDTFPKNDVPLPANSDVQTYFTGGTGNRQGWTITLKVDKVKKTSEAYRKALVKAGFTVQKGSTAAAGSTTEGSFTAVGDPYDVRVIVSQDPKTKRSAFLLTVFPHNRAVGTTSTTTG